MQHLNGSIDKSNSNIDVWIVLYPSMFLNNFQKNMKGRIGISVVLRELGDFFLPFNAKRRWKLSCDRLYCMGEIETRWTRQTRYLAGHIGAKVGKFLELECSFSLNAAKACIRSNSALVIVAVLPKCLSNFTQRFFNSPQGSQCFLFDNCQQVSEALRS